MSGDEQQPDWRLASIDPEKLIAYALNLGHARGRHKARLFRSALGFDQANVDLLVTALAEGVVRHTAHPRGQNAFGNFYSVDVEVKGPNGLTRSIRTVWIVELRTVIPRLVTLYVRRRR